MAAANIEVRPGGPRRERGGPHTVAALMRSDVVTVSPAASIRELASLLYRHGISGVPVVHEDGSVVGTASVTDLLWLSDLIANDLADSDARVHRRELDERGQAPQRDALDGRELAESVAQSLGGGVPPLRRVRPLSRIT